ncbi:MAG: PAS domain S-box protein, partial [Nitrospinota bacterium]
MLRDITERKRIEESLRSSEEKFSRVFHSSPDPNAITTLSEGRILEINKSFERIFGYSREEVIGRTSTELNIWINPEERERFVKILHKKDFVQNLKLKLRARSGELRTCLVSADIIQLKGQKCLLSVVRDITEVKRSMQRQRVQTTITHIMAGSDTLEDVSIKLLQGIGESIDWDIGELWEVDEKGNVLRCVKIWHNPSIKIPTFEEAAREITFEMGKGFPGRIWAKGEPEWISDITKDSNFYRRDSAAREDIHGAFAFPIFHKGKITYIVCFYNRLILSPDNDLLKILGAVSIQIGNLFERKQAQEALRKSEERYRTLAEAANDAIFIVNHQGFIQYVNNFTANMAGYLPSEMTGMNIDNLFKPEVAKKYRDNLKKVVERGMPAYDEEKASFKDRTIWLGTLLCPITNESGDITAIMGISRDITGRKEAEHEMEIQKNYFQQLFENSPDGIVLLDTTDRIVNFNSAFNGIFQYPLDEIKGKKINDIIAPDSLQVEAGQLSLQSRNGVIYQKETIRKKRDGGLLNIVITGYPIMIDNQVVGACVIYVDITAQKQLSEQLRHAQKLESLGTLAGGIAHDFNNILAIIMGHASLLERACADPDKLALSIESINKATQRGAGLVRQLLTFARKTDTVFESVNINEIVKEVAKLFMETFPKTIIISTDLAEKLPSITADQNQVHQLLVNLCVNARDAMPDGGRLSISTGVVEGKFLLSRYPKAGAREYVRTSITDTGMGMDKDTLSRIFEPFFTTKGPGKGTGLGLSVVFGIVEQHNGFIDAESEVGKGTTFQVFFPVPERVIEGLEKQTEIIPEVPG